MSDSTVARDRPRSRLWPAFGLLQLVAAAAVALGVVGVVVVFVAWGPTPTGTIRAKKVHSRCAPAAFIAVGPGISAMWFLPSSPLR